MKALRIMLDATATVMTLIVLLHKRNPDDTVMRMRMRRLMW